jgi:hypothetical protein
MQFNVIDPVLFYVQTLMLFYNSLICYDILFEKSINILIL